MSFEDDVLAEGEPEVEFHAGIAGRLPGKRVSSAALIRNPDGELLMLDPTYKAGWELPGGMVEADEEPLDACGREVLEEIGLKLTLGPLLVVDWEPRHGVWGDCLNFVFDGGIVTPDQVAAFRLQEEEIGGFTFAPLTVVAEHVRPSMARRLAGALEAASEKQLLYLKFGRRRG